MIGHGGGGIKMARPFCMRATIPWEQTSCSFSSPPLGITGDKKAAAMPKTRRCKRSAAFPSLRDGDQGRKYEELYAGFTA